MRTPPFGKLVIARFGKPGGVLLWCGYHDKAIVDFCDRIEDRGIDWLYWHF
jgi:hypothetical protein